MNEPAVRLADLRPEAAALIRALIAQTKTTAPAVEKPEAVKAEVRNAAARPS